MIQRQRAAQRNKPSLDSNILVCGTIRGGTTWLAEVLSATESSTIVWEPLFPQEIPELFEIGFLIRQHIPVNVDWPEARAYFERVFRGEVVSNYTAQQSSVWEVLTAQTRIVKFTRANMMLPWLVSNFELPPPVLLIRHPCAQTASILQAFHGTQLTRAEQNVPNASYNKLLFDKYRDVLSKLRTPEEFIAADWCVENVVPLSSELNDEKWTTVFYEHLVMNPRSELTRIFERIGRPLPRGILERIERVSATSVNTYLPRRGTKQLAKWKEVLRPEQIERILAVVHGFGLDLYTDDLMPQVSR